MNDQDSGSAPIAFVLAGLALIIILGLGILAVAVADFFRLL